MEGPTCSLAAKGKPHYGALMLVYIMPGFTSIVEIYVSRHDLVDGIESYFMTVLSCFIKLSN